MTPQRVSDERLADGRVLWENLGHQYPPMEFGEGGAFNASYTAWEVYCRENFEGLLEMSAALAEAEKLLEVARREIERLIAERDEANDAAEALELAVSENLPEVTGDADGNLETNEICRIETVGLLYEEQAKAIDKKDARIAMLREALWKLRCEAVAGRKYVEESGGVTNARALEHHINNADHAIAETANVSAWLEGKLAEERERTRRDCQEIANHMLGNPSPDAFPNIKDGRSWNAACIRIEAAIRALGPRTGETS